MTDKRASRGRRGKAIAKLLLLLILAAVVLGGLFQLVYRPWQRNWGARGDEISRRMPGDEIITAPRFNATRAVTVRGRPDEIWPWIVQTGYGRGGFYSYDRLDHEGIPSAETIVAELQRLEIGDEIPLSNGSDGEVVVLEADRFLVLQVGRYPDRPGAFTWAWGLYPEDDEHTRLVTRLRWRAGGAASLLVIEAGEIWMMRKHMLGIKERVEKAGAGRVAAAVTADWPQWRGPRRDGSVAVPFPKAELVERLDRQWEREVGGGYSGPVAAGDRVWVHSRQNGREVVRSLRLEDGEVLWSRSYEAAFRQDDSARAHGEGPYATPSLADGRLITFGVNAVLAAWDAETGELLWRRDSADEFDPAFQYFGAASSPLVWNDLCFVHLGGHERIEAAARGPMVALRVSDGREVWRWNGGGPSVGASPVIHHLASGPQLVFKTFQTLVGLDPRTGRELWQIPFRVPMEDNTIVTPLPVGDRLVTSDWDLGMIALEARPSGETWEVRPAWKHREISLSMSSPVLAGGLLVGFSHFQRGQLFVLDPEDGRVLWRGARRGGEHASLISWDDRVLVAQEDGTLLVARVSREGLQPIKRYRLGRSVVWSHPAIAGNRIVFRDGDRLAVSQLVR